MKTKYKDALAEVDEIFKYIDRESLDKIPESLIKFIQKNKSNYKSKINPDKSLNAQELLYETKVVLSVLYRDFWSTIEERQDIIEFEKKELERINLNKEENFNYETLFKNKNKLQTYVETSDKSLIISNNIFEIILEKIKAFFRFGAK